MADTGDDDGPHDGPCPLGSPEAVTHRADRIGLRKQNLRARGSLSNVSGSKRQGKHCCGTERDEQPCLTYLRVISLVAQVLTRGQVQARGAALLFLSRSCVSDLRSERSTNGRERAQTAPASRFAPVSHRIVPVAAAGSGGGREPTGRAGGEGRVDVVLEVPKLLAVLQESRDLAGGDWLSAFRPREKGYSAVSLQTTRCWIFRKR